MKVEVSRDAKLNKLDHLFAAGLRPFAKPRNDAPATILGVGVVCRRRIRVDAKDSSDNN